MKGTIEVKIKVEKVWLEEPTDLSKCKGCGDILYGKMYRLWIMPKMGDVNLIGYKTDMVLCDSCRNLVE